MRGGLGAISHVLTLDRHGQRLNVVLRRYREHPSFTPDHADREFRVLQMVRTAAIPSPEPLGLDSEARYFGRPALLLSYLPGRPLYEPADPRDWATQLVGAMLSIHAVTPQTHDLSWLPRFTRDEIASELERLQPRVEASGELATTAKDALLKRIDDILWPDACLIHEDFWPGNTVWYRGRLNGVIDWANAKLGDPRCDVSQCCVDVALVHGVEAAASIRDIYQGLAPRPLPDMWYFELFNGLRALLHFRGWLVGYHDAGQTQVTEELAQTRIEQYLRLALEAAGSG